MPLAKFKVQKSTLDGVDGALVVVSIVSSFQVPLMSPLASTLLRNAVKVRPSGSATKPSFSTRKSPTYGADAPRPPVGSDVDNAASGTIREGRTNQEPVVLPDVAAGDSSCRYAGTSNVFGL